MPKKSKNRIPESIGSPGGGGGGAIGGTICKHIYFLFNE